MLISSYGSGPRPRIHPHDSDGIRTSSGAGTPASLHDVAIVGLHLRPFAAGNTQGKVGMHLLHETVNWLVEDCLIEGFKNNLTVQSFTGTHRNFRLRRSTLRDAFATTSHSQGFYCSGVDGVLIEENLFDHNGWAESVSGAEATVFNHNLYMAGDNTGNIVVRKNVSARASSHGLYMRAGGLCEDNLMLRNPIGLEFGGGEPLKAGGATGTVRGNVVLDGYHIDGNNRGWGMNFSNINGVPTCVVEDNIVAHNVNGHVNAFATSIKVDGADGATGNVGVHNILFRNNLVYDWGGEWEITGMPGSGSVSVSNLQFDGNVVQNGVDADPFLFVRNASSTSAFSQFRQGRFFGLARAARRSGPGRASSTSPPSRRPSATSGR